MWRKGRVWIQTTQARKSITAWAQDQLGASCNRGLEAAVTHACRGASESECPPVLDSVSARGLISPSLPFSQMEPKRLKKQLPKILRLLKPDDRILIVGTTQRPFDAELQSFCKVYQKIILVPRPDYASRFGKYLQPLPGDRDWGGARVGA